MSIYADTNFFTYLYLEDAGSGHADALMRKNRPILPITWLQRIEVVNAFEQSVLAGYGESQSRISPQFAAACQQQFRDDLRDAIVVKTVHVSLAELTRLFEEISMRHTAKYGFRTYDILHVASALILKCRSFWSFDKRASKLAKLEGLKVL